MGCGTCAVGLPLTFVKFCWCVGNCRRGFVRGGVRVELCGDSSEVLEVERGKGRRRRKSMMWHGMKGNCC